MRSQPSRIPLFSPSLVLSLYSCLHTCMHTLILITIKEQFNSLKDISILCAILVICVCVLILDFYSLNQVMCVHM